MPDPAAVQPVDAQSYVMASMGLLGMNREHYSLERYLTLVESNYQRLASAACPITDSCRRRRCRRS